MDHSVTMESLDDTPSLPELSFDDLLDVSPLKKNDSLDLNDEDDPIAINEDDRLAATVDHILNTPVAKKKQTAEQRAAANVALTTSNHVADDSPMQTTQDKTPMADSTVPSTKSNTNNNNNTNRITNATTTPTTTNKSVFTKSSGTFQNQFIKLTSKPVGTTTTTTSAISTATIGGKTAVKTASGQIIYIQKTTPGQLPTVRLQPVSPVVTAKAATGNAANSNTSGSGSQKSVAIQVVRTADGTLVPLTKTMTTVGASIGNKANPLTLSPQSLTAKIAAKKILTTTGAQVLIKSPLGHIGGAQKTAMITKDNVAAAAKSTTNTLSKATTVAASTTSATTTTTAAAGSATTAKISTSLTTAAATANNPTKIVVKSGSVKPIVVSNQSIIKLSPKIGQNTSSLNLKGGIPSASGGHLHAIQIPGKPGMQWVRVLPQSKLAAAAAAAKSTTSAATTASSPSAAAATTTTATSTTTATNVKILNSIPQKFTVVRPLGNSKFVLAQSPKVDGGTTATLVNKAVSVIRGTVDGKSLPVSAAAATTAGAGVATTTTAGSLVLKSKISDINSEIKRITNTNTTTTTATSSNTSTDLSATECVKKIDATGKRVLLMPMVRATNGQMQRVMVQSSSGVNADASGSPKVYSVVKSSAFGDAKAKMKSYIICGQAKALMAQQQQHKSVQQKQPKALPELDAEVLIALNSISHDKVQQKQQHQQQQHQQKLQKLQEQEELQKQPKQQKQQEPKQQSTASAPARFLKLKPEIDNKNSDEHSSVRRKHCNCSKSQCLKLYCDCFANGEFCKDCTCKDCFNNLDYEEERQRAIRNCLDRNPSAFKPKITTAADQSVIRSHNKGCNCKRSGCLKNYCECYEAKISCSSNCKCIGCRNIEDRPDLDMDPVDTKIIGKHSCNTKSDSMSTLSGMKRPYESMTSNSISNDKVKTDSSAAAAAGVSSLAGLIGPDGQPSEKRACNIITEEVVDATIQCMMSQADECDKKGFSAFQTECLVMEELGRCLKEIIDFSLHNSDLSFSQE